MKAMPKWGIIKLIKGARMGKKDIILKQYFSDNKRFAEIFNHTLFSGQEIIKPEKLKPVDSAQADVIALRDTAAEFVQKNRDIAKIYDDELELVILGVENQNDVHYAMPMRVLLYDALSYDKQYQSIRKEHHRSKDLKGAERLSGFSREDKLVPVVTLVVYYGTEAWDGPRSMHDMLKLPKAFAEFPHLVGNYPMHLLEVRKIADVEVFDKDLMALFGFIKYQQNSQELENFIQRHADYFNSMARETYTAITHAADIKDIEKYIEKKKETEAIDMCDALKQMQEESLQRGRREGAQQSLRQVAEKMLRMNHPIPLISEVTNLSEQEIIEIKKKL